MRAITRRTPRRTKQQVILQRWEVVAAAHGARSDERKATSKGIGGRTGREEANEEWACDCPSRNSVEARVSMLAESR